MNHVTIRKPYSNNDSNNGALMASYPTLMHEDGCSAQRMHCVQEVCNALRWIGRTGAQWRILPFVRPAKHTVSQQMQRLVRAGTPAGPWFMIDAPVCACKPAAPSRVQG
jgi:hypothetical protein